MYRLLVTANRVEIKYCLSSKIVDSEAEESGTEENGTEENGTKEGDNFEDCNEILQITPTSHIGVTSFN